MKNNILIKSLLLASTFAAMGIAQPVVSDGGVVNAASYANPGIPSGAIAQGSMFIVFGARIGPATLTQVSSYPLPTSLGGTSIKITSGGTTVDAYIIYTTASQVAAILPSNTPVGNATIALSFGGQTSAPKPFRIVASSFGVFTRNQAGTGPGIFQNVNSGTDQPVNSYVASAKPGQAIIIWGTGLGSAPGNEAGGPIPGDLTNIPIEVYVGGKLAAVTYRGRSGCCSGIDQIVFTVPDGVEGCNVPVSVRVGGVTGNFSTIAVARNGGTCSSLTSGSAAEIAIAQRTGSYRHGTVALSSSTISTVVPGFGSIDIKAEVGSGSFIKSSLDQLLTSSSTQDLTLGSCIVTPTQGASQPVDSVFGGFLDAGTQINVNGPKGLKVLKKSTAGGSVLYSEQLSTPGIGGIPGIPGLPGGGSSDYLTAGSYAIDNGSGGADVGGFRGTLTIGAPLNWTNAASISTVIRTNSLPITWTGGDANGYAIILGVSAVNDKVGASFACLTNANAGSFTVPSWVLQALPATAQIAGTTPFGVLGLSISGAPVSFTASGLDSGYMLYNLSNIKSVDYR